MSPPIATKEKKIQEQHKNQITFNNKKEVTTEDLFSSTDEESNAPSDNREMDENEEKQEKNTKPRNKRQSGDIK